MKKVIASALSAMILSAAIFTGCTSASGDLSTSVNVNAEKAEYEGEITSMKVNFTNNSGNELYISSDFTIEQKSGDVWTEVEREQHITEDLQFVLAAGNENGFDYSVSSNYGLLDAGEYRIGMEVSFDDKMPEDKVETLYAEFTVK